MSVTTEIGRASSPDPVRNPIRLGPQQRAEIARAICHLLFELDVELIDQATIMVSPLDGEDLSGPTIVIRSEMEGFRIDAVRSDAHWNIAERITWPEVVRTVRMAVSWEFARPYKLH